MQVYGHLPLESRIDRWGHLRQQYESGHFEVVKLFGPVYGSTERYTRGRSYIYANVKAPAHVSGRVESSRIQVDGSCRIPIDVGPNYEALAAFLASGDLEWDVREMA
ncbi:hypothetical protein P0D71_00485 [Paraburkholderia sp. RL17-383-BIF-A]|uniref:hypothetical protein n=1 Tax=Paraburkholderia sp. RL17-383-BIF-A TaxID=3031631 RepID=UPI0038B73E10